MTLNFKMSVAQRLSRGEFFGTHIRRTRVAITHLSMGERNGNVEDSPNSTRIV
jgi:hypothetical protein